MRRLAVAVAITLSACRVTEPGEPLLPGQPVEFRRDPAFQQFRGYSGINQPETSVIRDAEEWERTWARVVSSRTPMPPTPAVDFSRDMVVLIGIGMRPNGGYLAEVIQVVSMTNGIGVDYRAVSPGANCINTQALTQPIDLVVVPRIAGEAMFARHDQVHNC